ncbi:putative toll [Penaeus vannamei]|uniref:Putative toll n=1 Tax=Penaeus vannamei TaxID=6689 RepID=A0A3R7LW07_PENVA|nr:putative toll [Penaeus vannamei]
MSWMTGKLYYLVWKPCGKMWILWVWCLAALLWAVTGNVGPDYHTPDDCQVTSLPGTDLVALLCRLRTNNSELDATNFSLASTRNTVKLRIECSDVIFFQSALQNKSFVRLRELQELDIEYCKIGEVPREAFLGLTNLRNLTLRTYNADWSVVTLKIANDAFMDQKKLEYLDLGNNNIWTLPPALLCELENLRLLNLSRNKLQDVTVLSFSQAEHICAPGLRSLDISFNHLVSVPAFAFAALKSLQVLNVSLNGISKLEDKALFGLSLLLELELSDNQLTNTWVNSETFTDLLRLASLDMSNNKITRLDAATFRDLTNLQVLKLQQNMIETISDNTFSGLFRLHTLVLSDNRVKMISDKTFGGLIGLQVLKLDGNEVFSIDSEALVNSTGLQELQLSHNHLQDVPKVVKSLASLRILDLSGNHTALRLSQMDPSRDLPEFYLGGNPFECDCTMEWLQTINSYDQPHQRLMVIDLDSIECRLMNNKGKIPLLDAKKLQFLCEYDSHCFTRCKCCDFDACDCEMTCPANCTCFHDNSWAANIVDCSRAGYGSVPERIPMDSSEVYLDGNALSSLSSHTFIGRKNMRVLYLNDSGVEVIHNRTFNGLKLLETLYLHRNSIKELKGYEFEHLTLLRELYLHDNELFFIQNTTFLTLASLRVLRLDNNRLKTFPVNMFSKNHNLHSLHLSENPWTCDCENLRDIQAWLQGVGRKLRDADKIYCALNGSSEVVAQVSTYNHSSCNNETETTTIRHEAYLDYVFLPTITLGAFAVLLTITLIVFCNRNRMRVWVYAKYGVRLFYRSEYEGDTDKAFDAFVSYSSKDEVFVTQILAPELERGSPAYKLCLHYRDFPVGAYITDTILSAVETSKRTILILSENFIKSEWCRFEFRSAHHEVLKDRRRRLIVILLGDVPQRDLDPDIRLYLKTNTYLKWGDTHFWEKLKFAMPDAQPPTRNHQLHAIAAQQQPGPRPVPLHT